MSNEVAIFNFQSNNIRVVMLEGNPWFVAADVCKALGFALNRNGQPNVTWAVNNLDDAERSFSQTKTLGATSRVRVISESGLYKLIMRSDKPNAKPFQDWVTQEVLPSIRKTGAFVVGQPSLKLEKELKGRREGVSALEY